MVGNDDSAGLILCDTLGNARAWLAARRESDNGLPLLWFKDGDGRVRMVAGYHLDLDPIKGPKYVGPTIQILDQEGRVAWKAP
jgi:hypothetical protein